MKCDKRYMLLYAVTDRAWTGEQTLYEQVEAALKGGVTCVQLREKEMDETAFLQEAKDICALCHRYGVPFIVNDNVDVAIACQTVSMWARRTWRRARFAAGWGTLCSWVSLSIRWKKHDGLFGTVRTIWVWGRCSPQARRQMWIR